MPFSLDYDPSNAEIAEAVNYLLSNFNNSVFANQNSGEVVGPSGEVVSYLYKYIQIKYADSFDGSVNFSNVPTNRLYYGIRNTDSSVESTNPADYIWTQITGGFGTTKFLWYIISGGRSIQFQVSTSQPNPGWVQDGGSSIDLDYTTTAGSTPANFVIIRVPNNSAAPTSGEVLAAIGRNPIDGDLATVNYNSGLASLQYKYQSGGWAIFQKYITGDLIVANTITASNIASKTITADQIATFTITADEIAANTITAAEIAANTITAAEIAVATITANNMAANSITVANGAIADATVQTLKIAGNAVTVPITNQYPAQIIRTFVVSYIFETCGTLSSIPGYYVSIQGVEQNTPIYLQTTFSDQTEIYNPSSPSGVYPLIRYKILRFHYDINGNLLTTYTVSALGEVTITSNGQELYSWRIGPGVYGLSSGIVNAYNSRVFTYVDSSPSQATAPIFQYFINGWGDDVSQGAGGVALARCSQFTTFLLATKR